MGVINYSLLYVIMDYNADDANDNLNDKNENKNIFNQSDNEAKVKYIKLGDLNYFRQYTWDTLGKTIMHKFNLPTVISPKKYDERFLKN